MPQGSLGLGGWGLALVCAIGVYCVLIPNKVYGDHIQSPDVTIYAQVSFQIEGTLQKLVILLMQDWSAHSRHLDNSTSSALDNLCCLLDGWIQLALCRDSSSPRVAGRTSDTRIVWGRIERDVKV